jgi:hypothetical protein
MLARTATRSSVCARTAHVPRAAAPRCSPAARTARRRHARARLPATGRRRIAPRTGRRATSCRTPPTATRAACCRTSARPKSRLLLLLVRRRLIPPYWLLRTSGWSSSPPIVVMKTSEDGGADDSPARPDRRDRPAGMRCSIPWCGRARLKKSLVVNWESRHGCRPRGSSALPRAPLI